MQNSSCEVEDFVQSHICKVCVTHQQWYHTTYSVNSGDTSIEHSTGYIYILPHAGYIRAIEVSHSACKYEFRRNSRSHSCFLFNFINIRIHVSYCIILYQALLRSTARNVVCCLNHYQAPGTAYGTTLERGTMSKRKGDYVVLIRHRPLSVIFFLFSRGGRAFVRCFYVLRYNTSIYYNTCTVYYLACIPICVYTAVGYFVLLYTAFHLFGDCRGENFRT